MLDIAKEITKIRKELNLTQVQFSKLIGIEQPYLSKIESGKNIPTLGTLSEIFSNLGYIMNVTVTKEENTVENKKSYPTSETITLVFRDKDGIKSDYFLHYRAYEYDLMYSWHKYTVIRGSHFTELLNYLERTFSISFPTKTPKKVILYFSSGKSVCTLRFYTNSNQYKSSNYVDIDLEPVFFSDSDTSHSLSMVKFSSDKEPLEERVEEVESIVEKKSDLVLKDYIRYLDRLYRDDCNNHYDPLELNAKLVGVHILYFAVLGFSVEDVKRHYFERCASLK